MGTLAKASSPASGQLEVPSPELAACSIRGTALAIRLGRLLVSQEVVPRNFLINVYTFSGGLIPAAKRIKTRSTRTSR